MPLKSVSAVIASCLVAALLTASLAQAADDITYKPGSRFSHRWTSKDGWGGKAATLKFVLPSFLTITQSADAFSASWVGQGSLRYAGFDPIMVRAHNYREAFKWLPGAAPWPDSSNNDARILAQGKAKAKGSRWAEITYMSSRQEEKQITYLVILNQSFNGRNKRHYWGFAFLAGPDWWPDEADGRKFAASVYLGK